MYAGFWLRFAAQGVDWALLILVDLIVFETGVSLSEQLTGWPPETGVLMLVITVTNIGWYTFFTASPMQASPGKFLLGLRVLNTDLKPCGFARALIRTLGYIPSTLLLGFGFLLATATPGKRTLHDYLAGTRVLRDARAEPARRRRSPEAGRDSAIKTMRSGVMLGMLVIAATGLGVMMTGDHVAHLGKWFANVVDVIKAGDTPGTRRLDAMGCRTRLITLAQADRLVQPFAVASVLDPNAASVPYLSCRRKTSEAPFDCSQVAKQWLYAEADRPMAFIVAVYPRHGWAPLCRGYFSASGSFLGSVGAHGALMIDSRQR